MVFGIFEVQSFIWFVVQAYGTRLKRFPITELSECGWSYRWQITLCPATSSLNVSCLQPITEPAFLMSLFSQFVSGWIAASPVDCREEQKTGYSRLAEHLQHLHAHIEVPLNSDPPPDQRSVLLLSHSVHLWCIKLTRRERALDPEVLLYQSPPHQVELACLSVPTAM